MTRPRTSVARVKPVCTYEGAGVHAGGKSEVLGDLCQKTHERLTVTPGDPFTDNIFESHDQLGGARSTHPDRAP